MIGTLLNGRYELTALLSEGTMFSLYSAVDRQFGRDVSIRIVKPPFSSEADFLSRLAGAVARQTTFRNPNCEVLWDVSAQNTPPFVVGELTRAPSLADRMRKLAPFSIQVSVATAISICKGIDALHRQGIVHGGLTPQNVVVLGDGECKLQLAGIYEAYPGSNVAASVVLPSLAPYLAPEVSSEGHPSQSSDVYALGVVLFELLTARKPYPGETMVATIMKHRETPTPSVRSLNPSVPAVLDEIVAKAMAKSPSERYASAAELLADLRILQDALRFGRPLSWPIREQEPTNRQKNRVAPKMSALSQRDRDSDVRERDVPVWMMMLAVFCGAVVVSFFGIWFFFNLDRPKMETVPNLAGLSIEDARSTLSSMKLKIRIGPVVVNGNVPADHIISVQPGPGNLVVQGTVLVATMSEGAATVAVPNLLNMTEDEVKTALSDLHLVLSSKTAEVVDSNVQAGLVAQQSPAPSSIVPVGTHIHITLSESAPSQPSASTSTPPTNIQGSTTGVSPSSPPSDSPSSSNRSSVPLAYTYSLHVNLNDLDHPAVVRIVMVDSQGKRIVHEQLHPAGDEFDITADGSDPSATFLFYYDGKFVKSVTKQANAAGDQSP